MCLAVCVAQEEGELGGRKGENSGIVVTCHLWALVLGEEFTVPGATQV